MFVIAIGIIIALLLFKVYPSKSKNDLKRRAVQTILMFVLIVGLIIAFRVSLFMTKFVIGIILGIVLLFLSFRRRQKRAEQSQGTANNLKKITNKQLTNKKS